MIIITMIVINVITQGDCDYHLRDRSRNMAFNAAENLILSWRRCMNIAGTTSFRYNRLQRSRHVWNEITNVLDNAFFYSF